MQLRNGLEPYTNQIPYFLSVAGYWQVEVESIKTNMPPDYEVMEIKEAAFFVWKIEKR
ncbi:MAG: hypothetical protein ABIN36_04700 [Ferruginibacter sp.]